MSAPRVKQLEWEYTGSMYVGRAGLHQRCIRVGWSSAAPFEFGLEGYTMLDDAMAAAQLDFERRILSALA